MISIVVPIFNAETYLVNCIESILNQSYKNIEIILVDDGSTDKSRIICDQYARKDPRISVIHKSNGGVSSARNIGIEMASGEYISFVDADDILKENLMLNLLAAINEETDLVIAGIRTSNGRVEVKQNVLENIIVSREELGDRFDELYRKGLVNAPFAKLYRTSILKKMKFPKQVAFGEDLIFNLEYINTCNKKIAIISDADYIYNVDNTNSATKRFRVDDFEQICILYKIVDNFCEQQGIIRKKADSVDRRLCYDGIHYIQSLFSSDLGVKQKWKILYECLDDEEFRMSCRYDYKDSIKQKIPRYLCAGAHMGLLGIYLQLYNLLKRVLS